MLSRVTINCIVYIDYFLEIFLFKIKKFYICYPVYSALKLIHTRYRGCKGLIPCATAAVCLGS